MTIEASRLRIDLQHRERWRRTMNVTVPADVVREERVKVLTKLAKKLKLPGFRAGKVPASVVESRFGPTLNKETLDSVIGEAYREALRVESLRPISQGEVEDVKYEPEQDLVFSVSFDVHPEIQLGRLGGFRIRRPRQDAGDEDVQRVLQRLRDQGGSWQPVSEGAPQEGDLVSVTVTRLGDGAGTPREYDLVLGQGDAIPDVEKAIATLAPGGSEVFTVRFPEDFPEEARRGEEQRLEITLRERKVRELPELDDAFARTVGDFADLSALQERIRADLRKEAEEQAEAVVRGRLLDQIVEANAFDVPLSMVDRYVETVVGDTKGVDAERLQHLREQLRPEGERAVKRLLVIERLAETHGLRVTEAELDERIEGIAGQNQVSPAEVYGRLQKAGRLETLEREMTEDKVFAFLRDKSQIENED